MSGTCYATGVPMTHFEWSSALETGNDEIDEQHRGLFSLANALQECD